MVCLIDGRGQQPEAELLRSTSRVYQVGRQICSITPVLKGSSGETRASQRALESRPFCAMSFLTLWPRKQRRASVSNRTASDNWEAVRI